MKQNIKLFICLTILMLGIKYLANAQEDVKALVQVETGKGYRGATYIKVTFTSIGGIKDDTDQITYHKKPFFIERTQIVHNKLFGFVAYLDSVPPKFFYIYANGERIRCEVKGRSYND